MDTRALSIELNKKANMKASVVLRASVMVLLVGCQSGPTVHPAATVTQAQDVRASVPTAPSVPETTGVPVTRSPIPAEPGPALILKEIQSQAERSLREQRWDSSIALAEQGLRIDRRQPAFYLILSESYFSLGDFTQAQRFADQASRLCGKKCAQAEQMQRRLREAY